MQIAGFFKIHTQHLLVAAQNAQLGNRLAGSALHQTAVVDACLIHKLFEQHTVLIVARHAAHKHLALQMRQVGRNVRRAAQHRINLGNSRYRHRCLRRNALHLALKIAVQHDVANDSNTNIFNLLRQKSCNS